jgi:hypothetical protein
LKDRNFALLSVAFDTGGPAAVREFIRPAEPIEVAPPIRDIMGWDAAEYSRAAAPKYPCLIDQTHLVAELYNMPNVPMAAWIDERGRIVRPAEPAGATDGFRKMDRATFQMPQDIAAAGRAARKRYVDAVRDWVANGAASAYALPEDAARGRIKAPTAADALATANFRLGQYLREQGHGADAHRYFTEARRLCPERWHYLRQTLDLEEPGKGSGPEFFTAVDALGDRAYYPPVDLGGESK